MKARGCANGRPQGEYFTKEESSSPTVSIYALMGLCFMDTIDKRKVITIDIPGAFLQGNWSQDEHPGYIMFEGIIVDMIWEINPSYHDKIIWSKYEKIIIRPAHKSSIRDITWRNHLLYQVI